MDKWATSVCVSAERSSSRAKKLRAPTSNTAAASACSASARTCFLCDLDTSSAPPHESASSRIVPRDAYRIAAFLEPLGLYLTSQCGTLAAIVLPSTSHSDDFLRRGGDASRKGERCRAQQSMFGCTVGGRPRGARSLCGEAWAVQTHGCWRYFSASWPSPDPAS